jgi:hypothetical protein
MPKSADTILPELYDLLKTKGFNPKSFKSGKKSVVPGEATLISFRFKDDDKEYGTSHVAIDNLRQLILFYNRAAMRDAKTAWTSFIKELKNWGMRRGIQKFDLDTVDNLQDYLERRESSERLDESYHGTKYTSYSDKTPKTVKLIIKHNKALEETDKRYRHVDKIFVENEQGERFILPTKKPSVGYVYARLIAEGGNPYDERGKHIAEISEDISRLAGFVRATKSKQFNESIQSLVSEATEQYYKLRETLHKLRGSRGFREYFENWQPTLMENDTDIDRLKSAFENSSIDPRIEQALPTLSKFNINVSEMTESYQFEDWANDFLNEELKPNLQGQVDELIELLGADSDPLPLGPDATNVLGVLENLIDDDKLSQRLIRAAEADPNNDARPLIIGWMSEHSDDDMYREVLDSVNPEEEESMPQETPPAEPSDANNNAADAAAPIEQPNIEMPPEQEEPAPELPGLPGSAPKQQKPLKESADLQRLRVLSGLIK